MLICGFAIYLNDRGPVIFKQLRVGINQQNFYMYKFRTMHVRSEEQHQELVKQQLEKGRSFLLHLPNDQRHTAVGKFLRKFSLDELPQLFNVLAGNMSLVGPRPMLPEETDHLSTRQLRRFEVLPGITGLAQINGRSLLPPHEYVNFDLKLIDEFSPALYCKILLKTPVAILSTRGAT